MGGRDDGRDGREHVDGEVDFDFVGVCFSCHEGEVFEIGSGGVWEGKERKEN